MSKIKFFKETALPAQLEPDAIYLIGPEAEPDILEIYVTSNDGSATRRTMPKAEIQQMIDASKTGANFLEVVDTITERDALLADLDGNILIHVTDASGDNTVDAGSAMYAYRHSDQSLRKVSEGESLDVILQWDNIQGKPNSSSADIDDAVAKKHVHGNLSQLAKVGEDDDGNFTYGGAPVKASWEQVSW